MSTADILERPVVGPADSDGTTRTHIVNCPPDKETTEAWITEARVFGLPVTALCGYVWVPEKDPAKYPVCQTCVDVAGRIVAEVNGA